MVTTEQIIQQERAKIAQAKAQTTLKKQQVSRMELMRRSLLEQRRMKALQSKRYKQSIGQLAQISKAEKAFEAEVSKYQAQLGISPSAQPSAEYKYAQRQAQEWAQAEKIMSRGSRYDPRSAVGKKIQKLYKHRDEAMKDWARAQAKLVSAPQPKGTYDLVTGSYVSPTGVGMTIAQSEIPIGTKLISKDISYQPSSISEKFDLHKALREKYQTPEQKKLYEQVFKPIIEQRQKVSQQQLEIKKIDIKAYKDMGFTPSQARKIADEGWKQKVSFSKEAAKQFLRKDERIIKKIGKGVAALNIVTWGAGGITPITEEISKTGIIEKGLTGYTTKEYKELKSSQDKISTSSNKLNKNYKKFEDKYKDKIKGNEFIGTEAEYKKYQEEYEKLNKEQEKLDLEIDKFKRAGGTISDKGIEMPKITLGSGFGLKGREVPIEKFEGLFSDTGVGAIDVTRKVGGAWDIGVKQMKWFGGEALGVGTGIGLTALGVEKIRLQKEKLVPEKQVTKLFDWTPRKVYRALKGDVFIKDGALTFPEYTRREVSLAPKEFGTQLGRATGDIAAFGGTTAKYAVPVAGGLFYAGEVGGSIIETGGVRQWIKEKPVEAALTGTVILGGAIFTGIKGIKTLQASKMSKQLTRLSERPVKYLEVIDKGKSQMELRALQETARLKRQIKIKGKIRKTEKGFEFIPEAEGIAITTGKIKRLVGKKEIFRLDVFKTGVKGTSIPYRTIGDIKWYKSVGLSTYEPLGSTYALFGKGTRFRDIKRQFKKHKILRGDVTKDIYYGDLFRLKESVFLGVRKDKEIGLTLIKKAKEVKDVRLLKPIKDVKRTPFSQTFAEEFGIPQKLVDIKIVKTGLTKQVRPVEVKTIQKEIPLMVGGTGLRAAPYTGTSLYETQEVVSAIKLDGITQPSFIEIKEREIQKTTPISISRFKPTIKEREVIKPALEIESIQKFIQPQKETIKTKQLFKQALQLKQTQQLKQIQKQKLAQRQAQRQAQREVPIKPKIKIPFKLGDAIRKVTKMAKEKPEKFEAFGKVLGKEKKIGTFKTQEKAEEKLGKFLKKKLSAAGFITKAGKKLKAEEIKLLKDVEFRKSKLSEFLIIEKKEKRLRKAGTGKDIQMFRSKPLKGRRKGKSLFGI